jgi:hypothetical protein
MAYAIVGGVVLVSLVVPLIIGGDGWFVPLVVLPFAAIYLLFDQRMRKRQPDEREPG